MNRPGDRSARGQTGEPEAGRPRAWGGTGVVGPDVKVTQISGKRRNEEGGTTGQYFNFPGDPVAGDKTQACPFHPRPHSPTRPFHKTQGVCVFLLVFFFAFFSFLFNTNLDLWVCPANRKQQQQQKRKPKRVKNKKERKKKKKAPARGSFPSPPPCEFAHHGTTAGLQNAIYNPRFIIKQYIQ